LLPRECATQWAWSTILTPRCAVAGQPTCCDSARWSAVSVPKTSAAWFAGSSASVCSCCLSAELSSWPVRVLSSTWGRILPHASTCSGAMHVARCRTCCDAGVLYAELQASLGSSQRPPYTASHPSILHDCCYCL
jgi:hypothetical protein